MTSEGRFFITALLLPVMKSRPSILNRFTVFPLTVIPPLSSIFAPGSASTNDSMTDPSGTLKAAALKTSVSSFTTIFGTLAVTTASSSTRASGSMAMSRSEAVRPFTFDTMRVCSL